MQRLYRARLLTDKKSTMHQTSLSVGRDGADGEHGEKEDGVGKELTEDDRVVNWTQSSNVTSNKFS